MNAEILEVMRLFGITELQARRHVQARRDYLRRPRATLH